MSQKQRIVSGMRPTGRLHLGHYLGVLTNWVKLQEDYECFFFVADWHALTTKSEETECLKENVINVVLDWLAAGVDPEKAVIYVQSHVPQIAELHIYLSMITPQNWVERDPTLKDLAKMVRTGEGDNKSAMSYGLFGYPVLMAADIMMFNVDAIPVGIDQVAHIEIERDIARRFNNIYKVDLFKEAVPKLTNIPLLKGLDGNKMGKSFNNDIKISDDEETTSKKVMKAITDRSRARKDDPGHPDKCEVAYTYWQAFADDKTLEKIEQECKAGKRGCADCKRELGCLVNEKLRPLREKRKYYENNIDLVHKILEDGAKKARVEADKVLNEVRKAVKMY